MLKKLMTLAAGAAVLSLASGCQTGSEEARDVPDEGQKFVVGVSIPAADHGWTAGVKWWAEEASKNYPNIEFIIEDAIGPDEQITDLENLRSENVDALVILATESAPLTPIAKQLHEAGILIVNVDRGFTEPAADVFIEGDNSAFGRKSAEYMVEKLGGSGKIVVLEGIPSTVNTARVDAAAKVFAQYPGIEIVAQDSGQWNREESEAVMQNILVGNPEIDAIWASDDDMALGVENALRAAGRLDGVWILGGAGMKDIVKRVMDGDPLYPADITYPPSMIAVGIHEAASILRAGRDNALKYMPKHMVLDVDLITPENAADYYFEDSIY
jgi:ribose transport system substrate-binding protein